MEAIVRIGGGGAGGEVKIEELKLAVVGVGAIGRKEPLATQFGNTKKTLSF